MATPEQTPSPQNPSGAPGSGITGAVAPGNSPGQSPPAPAAVPLPASPPPLEKSTVIPFGGNRGGRKRKDGLVPGSPEAREADLKRDRDRKNEANEAKRQAPRPAALPSATVAGSQDKSSPQGQDAQTPGPGVAGVPGVDLGAWTAPEAQPIVTHALPVLEHLRIARRVNKLREAKLPANIIAQVRSDSAWPETVKATLQSSLPGSLSKFLNFAGVPKIFKDELASLPAVALLIQHESDVDARLDRLLEAHKAATEPKPEAKN